MCPKKVEQCQRVESDKETGREIIEMGEQRLVELLEIKGEYLPIEVVDDEDIAAISSQFRESDGIARAVAIEEQKGFDKLHNFENEEDSYKQVLESIEALDDETNDIIEGSRSQANGVCGFDNMPAGNTPPNIHTFDTDVPNDVSVPLEMDKEQDFNEIAMESENNLDDKLGIDITQFLEDLEGIF